LSNINDMNSAIRRNTAVGAIALTVVGAVSIAPDAAIKLVRDGEPTKKLWWILLTGSFGLLALLIEAFDFGRHTPHRRKINALITTTVIKKICTQEECPQKLRPLPSTQRVAMGIFYSKIDSPSRDVAFYQWGWYYTSIVWSMLSLAVLVSILATAAFVSTDRPWIRWAAAAVVAFAFLCSYLISRVWRQKTRSHAEMQLAQIAGQLGGRLEGAQCPREHCPSI
jgi:hypothetical protein